ncbi:MAG: diacylglycerol kinase family lipid kinase [Trueperaceae bacterium]|nr:diacylglycerol kinase family lipid kinase [Trueperaceae bacterium]
MFDDRRVLVVLNPGSGRGRAAAAEPVVRRALASAGAHVELRRTGDLDDATAWGRAAADEGWDAVLAVGGDGTATAVARGLLAAGARVPLGIVPTGTGNGLARVLEVPMDPAKAVAALAAGRVVDLDVVEVTEPAAADGPALALVFLGAGLDADINRVADARSKARLGFLAYVWATLHQLPRLRAHRLTVTLDGVAHPVAAHTVSVFNAGRMVVAGVPVGPDADPHDGRLDVAVLRSPGFWRSAAAVARLVTRGGSRTLFEGATTVRIEADPPLPVHLDGDVVGTTPLEASVRPAVLRVLAAASYRSDRPEVSA